MYSDEGSLLVGIPVYSQRQSFQFGKFHQIRPQRKSRQSFPSPKFSVSKVFRLQSFPAPKFSVSKVFRRQSFPSPRFSGAKVFRSKVFRHQGFQSPKFSKIRYVGLVLYRSRLYIQKNPLYEIPFCLNKIIHFRSSEVPYLGKPWRRKTLVPENLGAENLGAG